MIYNSRVMLIGQMASGKSTVADYLVKTHGFKKISLATALKNIVSALNDPMMDNEKICRTFVERFITLTQLERQNLLQAIETTRNIPNEHPKPRKRLQYLGTDGGRKTVRDSIWIDLVKSQLRRYESYVIDDVRFPNEYQAFLSIGFTPIKLIIEKTTQDARLRNLYGNYDPSILLHDSEVEFYNIKPDLRFQINNDGPIDHLFHYVDLILGLNKP